MESTPTTRRRWFQFGIGSLLWLMLVAAVATYAVREHRENADLHKEIRFLRAKDEVHRAELKLNREERGRLTEQLRTLHSTSQGESKLEP